MILSLQEKEKIWFSQKLKHKKKCIKLSVSQLVQLPRQVNQ